MIKKTINFIFLLFVLGIFIVFASSCKKDNNDNDNGNGNNTGMPVLSTTAVTDITQTTAKSGGNITSDGSTTVTARGVCWSTNQTPTISDNKTSDGTGAGEFSSILSGLSPNSTYYVRAYATNINGTSYGDILSFLTASIVTGNFTDTRDGNVYQTVTISNQVWMAENLKYLPSVAGHGTGSQTTPYYYVYGYNGTNVADAKATANYTTYGVLYNWKAACSSCPNGWHLPSDAEWEVLINNLGGRSLAGGKLKATGTTHWYSPNTGATNETGFTALPGGRRRNNGTFTGIGDDGGWWSAKGVNATDAWNYSVGYVTSYVGGGINVKEVGFSVRCIKD